MKTPQLGESLFRLIDLFDHFVVVTSYRPACGGTAFKHPAGYVFVTGRGLQGATKLGYQSHHRWVYGRPTPLLLTNVGWWESEVSFEVVPRLTSVKGEAAALYMQEYGYTGHPLVAYLSDYDIPDFDPLTAPIWGT